MFKKGLITGFILGIVLIISAIGYLFYTAGSTIEETATVAQKERFKKMELILHDLEGREINLKDYSDKTILINFWGTWCAPCITEMPFLQEVYHTVKDDYVFLMITDESLDEVIPFTKKNAYDFTFALSNKKIRGQIPTFSTTYILDKDHNVTHFKKGSFDESNKESLVALLREISKN